MVRENAPRHPLDEDSESDRPETESIVSQDEISLVSLEEHSRNQTPSPGYVFPVAEFLSPRLRSEEQPSACSAIFIHAHLSNTVTLVSFSLCSNRITAYTTRAIPHNLTPALIPQVRRGRSASRHGRGCRQCDIAGH